MATTTSPLVAARWDFPLEMIEQGKPFTLTLRLFKEGVEIAPSAATVSLIRPNGTKVVDAADADTLAVATTYAGLGPVTASESRGRDWRVSWTATVDGVDHTFDIDAALVRRILFPVVTPPDIYARAPFLDPAGPAPLAKAADTIRAIADAWTTIQHYLVEDQRFPWLIVSPSALREWHLLLSIARRLEGMSARGGDRTAALAEEYFQRAQGAKGRLTLKYDFDGDGDADHDGRLAASGALWLGASP